MLTLILLVILIALAAIVALNWLSAPVQWEE